MQQVKNILISSCLLNHNKLNFFLYIYCIQIDQVQGEKQVHTPMDIEYVRLNK
jgi:hypothetical protein